MNKASDVDITHSASIIHGVNEGKRVNNRLFRLQLILSVTFLIILKPPMCLHHWNQILSASCTQPWGNYREFYQNRTELSFYLTTSRNLINHWSTTWSQFKDSLGYLRLPGTEVVCWSLTQKIAGSNILQNICTNSTESVDSTEFV